MNELTRILRVCTMCILLMVAGFNVYANPHRADSTAHRGWHGLSLYTNLVTDLAAAEPNLGLEFAVGEHWSVGGNFGIKTWPRYLFWDRDNVQNTRHWRNFYVMPEGRYYFKQVFDGAYVGANALYTHYNVGNMQYPVVIYPAIQDKRVQGDFWGGGLFGGYSWRLGKHWRIAAEAGATVGAAIYERFNCEHCGEKIGDAREVAVVPRLAVNVAYNIAARKKREKLQEEILPLVAPTEPVQEPAPEPEPQPQVEPAPVPVVIPEAKPESAGDRLSRQCTWVRPVSRHKSIAQESGTDSLLKVYFQINSDKVQRELGTNGDVLDDVRQVVEELHRDSLTQNVLVTVLGYASIDGPQAKNEALSALRAQAVVQQLNLNPSEVESAGRGEAWDWFAWQIKEMPEGFTPAELEFLQSLLAMPNLDQRESKLKANKQLYAKVVSRLLGGQRVASFICVYYQNAYN